MGRPCKKKQSEEKKEEEEITFKLITVLLIVAIFLKFLASFKKRYDVIKCLGKGGFGSVYSATRKVDNVEVAVKVIKKEKVKEWRKVDRRIVPLEVCFLKALEDIEGVVRYYAGFNFKNEYVMVMEKPKRCQDFYDYIASFQGLSQLATKSYFKQVVEIVMECAKRNIIHQDIKSENIIIDLDTGHLKLIDFGLSRYFKDPKQIYTSYAGTFYVAPPEWYMYRRFNGLKAAVWSLGALFFNMLTNFDPFLTDDQNLPISILYFESYCYLVEQMLMMRIFTESHRLLLRLLALEAYKRPSFEQILNDPYLAEARDPPYDIKFIERAGRYCW
uniref:Serine/threonine-protein kinase 1 n=1 Tax=Syphacia muris TaxID=451379 RepID=A0A0N5AEY3_9BILA